MRVKFLCCPLISWNFKSANKLVPLYTVRCLHNCDCNQRRSLGLLLFDTNVACEYKTGLAACKGDMFQSIAANLAIRRFALSYTHERRKMQVETLLRYNLTLEQNVHMCIRRETIGVLATATCFKYIL